MKFSIITAVYNRAPTIGDAIESVRKQSYPSIEHLIIDGQSNDGTIEQVLERQSEGMRIVSEPDNGIYDALNKGMRLAQGEVIGLVHSDDYLAHNRVLERVAAAFRNPNIDAAYGDLDYVAADDTDRVIRRWRAGSFNRKSLARGWMPPHPALFIRRSVFERYGGYDTRYQIAADYEAILRWFGGTGIRSIYLPETLVKMRVGGESNRSLERIMQKSREDLHAIRRHQVGGLGTLVLKNARKLGQFVIR